MMCGGSGAIVARGGGVVTKTTDLTYTNDLPREHHFYDLYQSTGWNSQASYTSPQLFKAIKQSWFTVSCYDGNQLVGFGRVVSDGMYQCLSQRR